MKTLILFGFFWMVSCGLEPTGNTRGTISVMGDVAQTGVDLIKASKLLDKRQRFIDDFVELLRKRTDELISKRNVEKSISPSLDRNQFEIKAVKQLIAEKKLKVEDVFLDLETQKISAESPYWGPKIPINHKKRIDELYSVMKRYLIEIGN